MKLTLSTVDSHGIVRPSPAELLIEARAVEPDVVDANTYAAMRMLASEDARHPKTWNLRCHVMLNDLDDLNARHPDWDWNVHDLIVYSSMSIHRGWFGKQEWGRRYASTEDPTREHLIAYVQVLVERLQGIDNAQGGVKFADREAMGKQHGSGSFEALVSRWAAERLVPTDCGDGLYTFKRV